MEVNPILNFLSKDDEIHYWMDVAHQMYQRKEDAERELQEYQEHSQLLERELETSFEQSDRRNRELRQTNFKLTTDNEDLKNRVNEQIRMNVALQSEVQDLKLYNDELLQYIRKLEQKNDDLERFNREKTVSEEELETQFNMTLEKLAILETEADELENLKIMIHRLQEENKDLRQQIQLELQKQNTNTNKSVESENEKDIKSNMQNEINMSVNNLVTDGRGEHEYNPRRHDALKYLRELELKLECSQKVHPTSKSLEEKLRTKSNFTLKRKSSLEKELREKGSFNTLMRWKDENRDWSKEIESRLRSRNEKNADRSFRARSDSIKYQEENLRNSPSNRLSRQIESRVKKVKEEEKRQQNLVWFLKRWRYSQLSWLRKKE